MTASWLDDERVAAYDLLEETHRHLEQTLAASLVAAGRVHGALFSVLVHLARAPQGRLRVGELAELLALTSGGATRLVDRAELAGLVTREPCPEDRRVSLVRMTAAGRDELERAGRVHLDGLRGELADRLTAQELDALLRVLAKLRARW